MFSEDTIAAVATAPGEGGIAVVRISGPGASGVLSACFQSKKNPADDPMRMVYGRFMLQGRMVDMGYAVFMAGPATFSGEDTTELFCHGGSAVTALVLEAALSSGARMAQRGEFSRRAFLNGRMDLTQAEAVMDMVAARTDKAAAQALQQLKGKLGRAITAMADGILDMIAWIEVTCDYPEEDIDQETVDQWIKRLRTLERELDELLKTASGGRILREGLRCALVGLPNVGKSSLLNALLREDRVIVTPVAGTTRDTVEAQVDIRGVPVTLIDTAGIRDSQDPVEVLGIARSREALEGADMAVMVVDAVRGMGDEEWTILTDMGNMPRIIALNKADLAPEGALALPGEVVLPLSALTGAGLEALEERLADLGGGAAPGEAMLTRNRHRDAVRRAILAVREGRQALEAGYPLDMATGSLRAAWHALGEVTGGTVDEDVIDRIFEKFCLGK